MDRKPMTDAAIQYALSDGSTRRPFLSSRAWENPNLSEIIGAAAGAMVVIGAVALVTLLTWKRCGDRCSSIG